MLNGRSHDGLGAFTCNRFNGDSTPDYMFVRGGFNTFSVCPSMLRSLSDHAALCVALPWALARAPDTLLG